MLKFNSLLLAAGLNPRKVRLVRHRHRREYQRLVFADAIRGDPRFEQYQSSQSNPRVIDQICSAEHIASFVADPVGQTVFIGIWQVNGRVATYLPDPYEIPPNVPRPGSVTVQLEHSATLSDYRGRIIVDWGGGERAWVQYADRRDKPIIELRRKAEEEPFPGFRRFACGLQELESLPPTWLEPLRVTRGVYLLIHRPSGAQYVGSATGVDGFLGRWRGYADGHGGNLAMRELAHPAEDYDVRILDTVGLSVTAEEVYELESLWKAKLGSRAQGLNRN